MAYDEGLAERIRGVLEDRRDVSEKRMFGGLAFLVKGHMSVGIVKDQLMVRVGSEAFERHLEEPHVRTMDFTGKPMKGFLYVAPSGLESDADLAKWVSHGIAFVSTLPAKTAQPKRTPPKDRLTRSAPRPGGRRRLRSGSGD